MKITSIFFTASAHYLRSLPQRYEKLSNDNPITIVFLEVTVRSRIP